MASQKKKRAFGGAAVFQMILAPCIGVDPKNIAP
jgi:hypothetical protein